MRNEWNAQPESSLDDGVGKLLAGCGAADVEFCEAMGGCGAREFRTSMDRWNFGSVVRRVDRSESGGAAFEAALRGERHSAARMTLDFILDP